MRVIFVTVIIFVKDEFQSMNNFLNLKTIIDNPNSSLLDYAEHYARLGFPVFPLHGIIEENGELKCSCNEKKCKPGKHPATRNGLLNATIDHTQISYWWGTNPNYNIGLVTGFNSGIFAVDIDTNKCDGEKSFRELESYHKLNYPDVYESVETIINLTGGGGRHSIFNFISDYEIKCTRGKLGNGIDIRGDGGYIVAPPSRHISGNQYQWQGVNSQISDPPLWLLFEILESQKKESKSSDTVKLNSQVNKTTKQIKDGEGRYDFFWKYICGLCNSFSKKDVLQRALLKNNEILVPPYDNSKVTEMVNYLYKKFGKK